MVVRLSITIVLPVIVDVLIFGIFLVAFEIAANIPQASVLGLL